MALACALLFTPALADAAGLGKLTVVSVLGQPLRAEIELVTEQPSELASLTARIASPDAFEQAKIQYNPALVGARATIEKRADGRPYIRVTSSRPLNEPYIDLLVELNWAQGRLVREYTALIDPSGYGSNENSVSPVVVAPPVAGDATPAASTSPSVSEQAPVPAASASATPPVQRSAYTVKRGDTLAKIAAGAKPQGVTLEQMLVSIYRNNPDAFSGNMNRLKTGTILRFPTQQQTAELPAQEAGREVRVQAADWNSYRARLAAEAGSAPEATSSASGKIATTADDKAASREAPKEVLKLSKGLPSAAAGSGNAAAPAGPERLKALEDEATARDKALTEANARIAQLEKNLGEMQRLLEIKGQIGAALPPQQPAAAPPTATGEIAKADSGKSEPSAAKPPVGAPAAPATASNPAAPATGSAPAPSPAAPRAVVPKPQVKPAAPPPAPSLTDQILGEPSYVAALGALIAALGAAGYWFARRRRIASETGPDDRRAPTLGAPESDTAEIVSRNSAPAGDDIDPLAEAELYLNFGRDVQAEEVLKEAVARNPKSVEALIKLLQIYAGRKDHAEFEKIARKLNTLTSGTGEQWQKAAVMGYALQPENPLYAAGKSAAAAEPASPPPANPKLDFDLDLARDLLNDDGDLDLDQSQKTVVVPGRLRMAAQTAETVHDNIEMDPRSTNPIINNDADFVLDKTGDRSGRTGVGAPAPMANIIDFGHGAPESSPTMPQARGEQSYTGARLSLVHGETHDPITLTGGEFKTVEQSATLVPGGAKVDHPELEFALETESGSPAIADIALDDIDLDFDTGLKAQPSVLADHPKDDHWYDVQTKFDLAKAYQEMGDKDGAREILQEVLTEGDSGQKAEAKQLLDAIV